MSRRAIRQWLLGIRATSRLAFGLQMATRILAGFTGLMWIRLLNSAIGAEVLGVFFNVQKVITLGGLGDLGLGGAVGIRVGRLLGQRKEAEAATFLASARTIFLLLAICVGGGMVLLSPWLPVWLHWNPVEGAGSLRLLFVVAAMLTMGVVLASYLSSVNYACGNVTWPILPAFVLLQLGFLGNWLLARQHYPLWIQCLPYVATAACGLWLTRTYIRISHPALAGLRPLQFVRSTALSLFENTFWVYLCSLGNAIYRSTDSLVITAAFGAAVTAGYECNYRFCDMVVFVALTASYVSMPKITQWMASSEPGDRARVQFEMRRLNNFQTFLGCGAALAYLAFNNVFMKIWWLHSKQPILPAPLELQVAFALNMVVTAGGDVGIQMAGRTGSGGLRFAGTIIGITGLLNLGLSIAAAMNSYLAGVALATVVAQSILSLAASIYVCRHLQIRWLSWALRGWALPCVVVLLGAWLKRHFPFPSMHNVAVVFASYAALLGIVATALGINLAFIKEEWAIVRRFLGK